MAKKGVSEGDQSMAVVKATELKRELRRLLKEISTDDDDDGFNLDALDRAANTLSALREFNSMRPSAAGGGGSFKSSSSPACCPDVFRCPLSKDLMRDPVIIATGETYDRPFIQRWLKAGHRTCPRTQQILSHTSLTPNLLAREMISQWCKNNGVKSSIHVQQSEEDGVTETDRDKFLSLLEKMSKTLADQKEAAKELRLLTKRMPSFRSLFSECDDAIPQLLKPLSNVNVLRGDVHPDLEEDLITTLLNLSIHDNNKKIVAETPVVIPILMDSLRTGTIATKSNAAAALFTLSALDSSKALIGKAGALKPLIHLLEEGHPLVMKDVASAIFNLCIIHENKARAVRDGAVMVILDKITSRVHVDELLAILAMLSSSPRAVEEMGELGAVSCLFSVIRESDCGRNKENCIAILHTICFSDRSKWKEMREEEIYYRTISQLAQNGTSRARRKASGILERLNRVINLTHNTA